MKNNKRGVSGIVTTVLLILVAITAVALIVAFLIPFIRGSLNESQECFSVLGKVEVVQGTNTCYDASDESVRVRIGRTFGDEVNAKGFAVVLGSDSKSKRFEVIDGEANDLVKELSGDYGVELEMPGVGEQRTYVFDVSTDFSGEELTTVEVSAILQGDSVCSSGAPVSIPACSA